MKENGDRKRSLASRIIATRACTEVKDLLSPSLGGLFTTQSVAQEERRKINAMQACFSPSITVIYI